MASSCWVALRCAIFPIIRASPFESKAILRIGQCRRDRSETEIEGDKEDKLGQDRLLRSFAPFDLFSSSSSSPAANKLPNNCAIFHRWRILNGDLDAKTSRFRICYRFPSAFRPLSNRFSNQWCFLLHVEKRKVRFEALY